MEDTSKQGIRKLFNQNEVYLNDSLCSNIEWYWTKLNNKRTGLISLIDIRNIKSGKNILKVIYMLQAGSKILLSEDKNVVERLFSKQTETIVFYKDN